MANAPVVPNNTKSKQGKQPTREYYIDKICYSPRYSDDVYEYRHVELPKPFLKMIPKSCFQDPMRPEVLRLLHEKEWREIGILQSQGWEHYEVHAPEPHILLFRRPLDFVDPKKKKDGKGKK